jgi:phosphoribosylaminoimidazole carboxylase PurE protein
MVAASKLVIFVGSESDLKLFDEAKVAEILDRVLGIGNWVADVLSTHRTPKALRRVLRGYREAGIRVFIAMMGLKPALPDTILEVIPEANVIGVPLPHENLTGAEALHTMLAMPQGGFSVLSAGWGKLGLQNAVDSACKIVSALDSDVERLYLNWRKAQKRAKPPKRALRGSLTTEPGNESEGS